MDKRFTVNKEALTKYLVNHITKDTIVVCVGTRKIFWDRLSPMVGTILEKNNFPLEVIGTMKDNVHAINLEEKINAIDKSKKIIAIDSAVGEKCDVGTIKVGSVPLTPGAGVDKDLGIIGDYSILGTTIEKRRVTFDNFREFGTKEEESMIKDMAFDIADALIEACKKFY